MRGLTYRSPLRATLFNNTNLGNDAEDQVVSTCDSKACRIREREIPADF
jgi:hypothetical protein